MRVSSLTPRQRQIVELRCGPQEMTVDEVAQHLNIGRNRVKNVSSYIISKLGMNSFNGVCRLYGEELVVVQSFETMRADLL